jgi:heme-degrading monooxygenase HmoA
MFARHWHLSVVPDRFEELMQAVQSLLPAVRQQWGFGGLLVLRSEADARNEVEVISLWDSLEAMRSSEKNLLFYQAMLRLKDCSHGLPSIREHQVLMNELPAARNVA